MKDYSVSLVNTNGVVFPGTLAINASGPSATDGTEWVKVFIDDYMGARQDLMVEAGKTPSGNDEAVGSSDFVAALKSLLWFDNLIKGLVCSNNVTDSDHDIDVSVGQAMDSTNAFLMKLTSGLIKQIDASWAVGTNAGGLFTGAVANGTWYAVFAIRADADGSVDAGFDISPVAANIPGGYTAFRRIGWVLTDGSANIIGFSPVELAGGHVDYSWDAMQADLSATINAARQLLTITSPIDSIAKISTQLSGAGTASSWVLPTTVTDFIPVLGNASTLSVDAFTNRSQNIYGVQVDSSNQIAYRSDVTSGTETLAVATIGYVDRRIE